MERAYFAAIIATLLMAAAMFIVGPYVQLTEAYNLQIDDENPVKYCGPSLSWALGVICTEYNEPNLVDYGNNGYFIISIRI